MKLKPATHKELLVEIKRRKAELKNSAKKYKLKADEEIIASRIQANISRHSYALSELDFLDSIEELTKIKSSFLKPRFFYKFSNFLRIRWG